MLTSIRRALLLLLAAAFLFEAWLWDIFSALSRWLSRHLPLVAMRRSIEKAILRAPPYVALALFVIPGLLVLPFKLGGLWLIAHGHVLWGGLVFLMAKFATVGVAAFLFELTRNKLMTLQWFARLYAMVMRWRDWAHRLADPYLAEIKARARELKAAAFRLVAGNGNNGLARRILRLRAQIWRKRSQR